MKKNHKGMIKGFTQLSRAWYGPVNLKCLNKIDEITFGFYSLEGGTTGEMSMDWVKLEGKIVPELSVFSDAWSALAHFHDLIDLLGEHDDEDPTPEQFCKYLLACGFQDRTETVQH